MNGRWGIRSRWLDTALAVLAGGVLFASALRDPDAWSSEAMSTESICRELTANTTEGRQALVSSLWRAPLPVLTRLPIAALAQTESCPAASLAVSCAFGAGLLWLLLRVLRDWKLGWRRYVVAGALAGNPLFVKECLSGSSGMETMCFAVLAVYSLAQWMGLRKVRYLVTGAACAACLAMSNAHFVLLIVGLGAVWTADLITWRVGWRQREAVWIVGALPLAYVAGLWVLMNWLIMGDGLYFLRWVEYYVPPGGWRHGGLAAIPAGLRPICLPAAGVSVLAGAVSLLRGKRTGFCLGLFGAFPLLMAALLCTWGIEWELGPVVLSCVPLCFLAVGYVAGNVVPERVRLAAVLMAPVLTVAMAAAVWGHGGLRRNGEYEHAAAERCRMVPQIERHLLKKSPWAKVFVCGYDSFLLSGAERGPVFETALDLDFSRIKREYAGHAIHILVSRPRGRRAMDSIHWKYDGIYLFGADSTLYDSDWGDWRLFEVVQAPRK